MKPFTPMKSKRRSGCLPGRPSKCTPTVVEAILHDLRRGQSLARAARGAAVHPKTVQRWRRQMPDFQQAIGQARRLGRARAALVSWVHHPCRGLRPPRKGARRRAPYPKPSFCIPQGWRYTTYRGGPH